MVVCTLLLAYLATYLSMRYTGVVDSFKSSKSKRNHDQRNTFVYHLGR